MRAIRTVLRAAILGAAASGAAGHASAADTSALGAVSAYATIASIGVEQAYTGDDDADATAWVEWRVGGAGPYTRGADLVRLPGLRFVGSVFFLDADTEYELRVVLDDPDNGALLETNAGAQTRADAPPPPSGDTWWVDASLGSDSNDGSAGAPLATIQEGAERAQAGDVVRVRPGVYRETLAPPRGGTPSAPIWFVAEGDGVVVDGSDPALASPAWTSAGGVWWTAFGGATQYVAAGDERLYDHASLADLQADALGVVGGFFVDDAAGRLYVKLPDGGDPHARAFHVAVRNTGFLLDTLAHVVVEGFEIRYLGATQSGVAVDVRDTSRAWVRDNFAHHMNTGFRVRRALASENVIEGNRFRDTSVFGWPWDAVKAHTPEASAIEVTHGRGNVVRRNDTEGSFNGIYVGAFGDASEAIGRDTDVHGNALRLHGDDGLEAEGACVNVRFWHDAVVGVFNGVSVSPIEVGPAWFVRNLVADFSEHAFKLNNGSTGPILVFHTTAVPHPLAAEAQAMAPSLPFGPFVSRNNVWHGNRYAIEETITSHFAGVDFDWDDLWTDDPTRFVKWLDVRYDDLVGLQAGAGQEANGFQVAPLYEDAAALDFDLAAGHALLDAGLEIAGINDAFVVGAGADVGAFERGGVNPWVEAPEPAHELLASCALACLLIAARRIAHQGRVAAGR
jgi:hypothetical protein